MSGVNRYACTLREGVKSERGIKPESLGLRGDKNNARFILMLAYQVYQKTVNCWKVEEKGDGPKWLCTRTSQVLEHSSTKLNWKWRSLTSSGCPASSAPQTWVSPWTSASGHTSSFPPCCVFLHPDQKAVQRRRAEVLKGNWPEWCPAQNPAYLGVFWTDFFGVDLRVCGHQLVPPLHFIYLPETWKGFSAGFQNQLSNWGSDLLVPSPGGRSLSSRHRWARSSPLPSPRWKVGRRSQVGGPLNLSSDDVSERPPPCPSPSAETSRRKALRAGERERVQKCIRFKMYSDWCMKGQNRKSTAATWWRGIYLFLLKKAILCCSTRGQNRAGTWI